MAGARANATGQVRPLFFNNIRCSEEMEQYSQLKWTLIFARVLGSIRITLVVSQVRPVKLIPNLSASMPIMVAMQLPKAAASKSVGEKVSP